MVGEGGHPLAKSKSNLCDSGVKRRICEIESGNECAGVVGRSASKQVRGSKYFLVGRNFFNLISIMPYIDHINVIASQYVLNKDCNNN